MITKKRIEKLEQALEPDEIIVRVCRCNRADDKHTPGCPCAENTGKGKVIVVRYEKHDQTN